MKQAMIWINKTDPGGTARCRFQHSVLPGAAKRRYWWAEKVEMQLGCQVDKGDQRDSETVE